ncbi:MAG TPA: hypothetical protein VFD84_11990 [Candidatus Binatia bacterium]|nr:hypothetical protein [Candidatus Binatia bacterium]
MWRTVLVGAGLLAATASGTGARGMRDAADAEAHRRVQARRTADLGALARDGVAFGAACAGGGRRDPLCAPPRSLSPGGRRR